MSNLTDFFPSGGGGLTPKFEEFNASGTFTPTQALIDAGGYIELFLVGAGGAGNSSNNGGAGGEVILKKMYLTNTNSITVTIGSGVYQNSGGSSSFLGSSAGGIDITSLGGTVGGDQSNKMGSGFGSSGGYDGGGSAGSGVLGYGVGGYAAGRGNPGVTIGKANSGQGSRSAQSGGSGYCLIKWYE